MGGYVAGPVMAAALMSGIPLVVMEPNAVPGFANRRVVGTRVPGTSGIRITAAWFPPGKCEVTGLPVRPEFFDVKPKRDESVYCVDHGRQPRGAHPEPGVARELALVPGERRPVRIVHQTGAAEHEALASVFLAGMDGEVVPFIRDMPEAFGSADLVVARAGGALSTRSRRREWLRSGAAAVCGGRSSAPKRGSIGKRGCGAHGAR